MNPIGGAVRQPGLCGICKETDSSEFGGRSLVKTSCSQGHQFHLDCIFQSLSAQEKTRPDKRLCNVCSEPAMPLLRNEQDLAMDAWQKKDPEAQKIINMLLSNPAIDLETDNNSNLLAGAAQNDRVEYDEPAIKAGDNVNVEKCFDGANDTEILYENAIQLLTDNINQLEKIKNDPATMDIAQSSQGSSRGINSIIKILKEEQVKLEEKEWVVVVVGTTNAGKSTAINALIGQNLLPKIHHAMTAIPIQIKHNPDLDKDKPVLDFNNPKPLQDLYEKLKTETDRINGLENDNVPGIESFRKILEGGVAEVTRPCTGAAEIYKHLEKLNDLVRLSKNFGIENPLAGFAERSHFPMIQVKFRCLPDLPKGNGNFILLDSPGLNEGNNEIKGIVREQMGSASAVFPVMEGALSE